MATNIRTTTNEYFIYWNLSSIFDRKKNKFLSPIIAKIFELNTIKGSDVILNIAGMDSTAKRISENSTTTSAASNEVAISLPFFLTK
jgi:hypothetical protein